MSVGGPDMECLLGGEGSHLRCEPPAGRGSALAPTTLDWKIGLENKDLIFFHSSSLNVCIAYMDFHV